VKQDITEPAIYAVILAMLLGVRLIKLRKNRGRGA
jgi:DMSO/TMAO reductase YedYZ heme-binding membrane subunit